MERPRGIFGFGSSAATALWLVAALGLGAASALGGCCRNRDLDLVGVLPGSSKRLPEARAGHTTVLIKQTRENEPAPEPPEGVFRLVKYKAPLGEQAAYVTPPPAVRKRHPAVIWLFGGFDGGIGADAWLSGPPGNDQSAGAFREAGIVMMYPSLRGGNDNPGVHECMYGEVDDVIAAAEYLESLDYVDPTRMYLGGHSTGATLALLVAESTDRFRAIFSLGPTTSPKFFGQDRLPFDIQDSKEVRLRSPILYVKSIKTPTLLIEGAEQPGNVAGLPMFERVSDPKWVRTHAIPGANHFSVIAPVTTLLADKVNDDTGAGPIEITSEEANTLMQKWGEEHKATEAEEGQ